MLEQREKNCEGEVYNMDTKASTVFSCRPFERRRNFPARRMQLELATLW